MAKRRDVLFGDPYVVVCPTCGRKRVIGITFGSGAYSCECSPGEIMRMDFISKDTLIENQKKYKDFIEKELNGEV